MEEYQIIATRIAEIRLLLNRGYLELPTDKPILDAHEKLTLFVIDNFELPNSHRDYIYKSFEIEDRSADLANEIRKKNKLLKGDFAIELQLRGVEAYFSWGKPKDITLQDLISSKYLISKLHGLVGDKTVDLQPITF